MVNYIFNCLPYINIILLQDYINKINNEHNMPKQKHIFL